MQTQWQTRKLSPESGITLISPPSLLSLPTPNYSFQRKYSLIGSKLRDFQILCFWSLLPSASLTILRAARMPYGFSLALARIATALLPAPKSGCYQLCKEFTVRLPEVPIPLRGCTCTDQPSSSLPIWLSWILPRKVCLLPNCANGSFCCWWLE